MDGHLVFVDTNGNGTFDPGEPAAYTDVNGDYALRDIHIRSSPGGKAIVSALSSVDAQGGLAVQTYSEAAPFDHADTTTRTTIYASFDLFQTFLFNTVHVNGSTALTPEMTASNTSVNDLAAELTSLLNNAGLGGYLFVEASGPTIVFYTLNNPFSSQLNMQFATRTTIVKTTYYADGSNSSQVLQDSFAPGALGFQGQASFAGGFGPMFAPGSAPTDPKGGATTQTTTELAPFLRRDTRTVGTATFTFTVDGKALGSISLTSDIVKDNTDPSDLVTELNHLLTVAGLDSQVVAGIDGDRLYFSTVQAGSTKSLVVEVQQHFVSTRTTTNLDNSTFDEVVADYTVPGGLGFGDRALASGSDKPQSSLEVYSGDRTDWVPSAKGNHVSVPVGGAGQITANVNFGVVPVVATPVQGAGVGSSQWSPDFAAALEKAGLADIDLTAPPQTLLSLPWVGIDRIGLTLAARVAEALQSLELSVIQAALQVSGSKTGAVTFQTAFDPASSTLTLQFGKALVADYYTLTVAASVAAKLGLVSTGDFKVSFAVQPGDITGDGHTNDADLYQVWRNSKLPVGQQDLRADVNGDGKVDAQDLALVRAAYLGVNPGAKQFGAVIVAVSSQDSTSSHSTVSVSSLPAAPLAGDMPALAARVALNSFGRNGQDDPDAQKAGPTQSILTSSDLKLSALDTLRLEVEQQ